MGSDFLAMGKGGTQGGLFEVKPWTRPIWHYSTTVATPKNMSAEVNTSLRAATNIAKMNKGFLGWLPAVGVAGYFLIQDAPGFRDWSGTLLQWKRRSKLCCL